jgi:hypothetical protein
MSLGGISDYLRANNISIPQDSSSGTYLPYANQGPYEEIMARMRASGGRGGSGGVAGGGGTTGGAGTGGAMGGYDPNLYKRVATAPTAGSGVIPEFSSVGPGSRGLSSEQRDERNDPNAWANLSDAQKANYYANNPTMAKFVQGAQKLFGYTTLGGVQKFLSPEFVENQGLIARGITPNATSEINTGNTAQDPMQRQQLARQLGLLATPVSDAAIPRYDLNVGSGFTPVVAAPEAAVATPVTYSPITTTTLPSFNDYSNEGRNTLPAGYAGGFTPVAAPVVAAPAIATPVVAAPVTYNPDFGFSEFTGYGGGGGGGGYGGSYGGDNSGDNRGWGSRDAGGLAKGGPVSMNRLQGPNPAGPDDGYATLKSGEFVINDKAVKKYGIELMNAINSGKISKGKLRGLLEM